MIQILKRPFLKMKTVLFLLKPYPHEHFMKISSTKVNQVNQKAKMFENILQEGPLKFLDCFLHLDYNPDLLQHLIIPSFTQVLLTCQKDLFATFVGIANTETNEHTQ